MPRDFVDLHWPTGGLNRRYGYQKQPPYTSSSCLNVRPDSVIDGRERGGSRPGLVKAFSTQLGSGNPIRLLKGLREVFSVSQRTITDDFDGDSLSSVWTAMPWTGTFNGDATGGLPVTPEVGGGLVKSEQVGTSPNWEIQAARRTAVNMDTAQVYTVTALIVPVDGFLAGEYFLFVGLDNTSPNIQVAGVGLKVICTPSADLTNVAVDISIDEVVAGVITSYAMATYATNSVTDPMTIYITVNGTNVTCGRNGSALGPQAVSASALPGSRIGFGVRHTENYSLIPRPACISALALSYFPDTDEFSVLNRTRMMAAANGILYRETTAMTFTAVANVNSLDLASDRPLYASERLGSLFIADNGIRGGATNGVIGSEVDSGVPGPTRYTYTFDSATYADWTSPAVASVGDILWIYNATTPENIDMFRIIAVTADKITVGFSTSGNMTAESGASFRILRGLKVYTSSTDTLSAWIATDGEAPYGASLISRHMGCVVLANTVDTPHAWYMSRQGDYYDFDYGAASTDLQRAIFGTQAESGDFGEPIRALIPWHDDHFIFGCQSSLWVLRGHPAQGGRIDNLSRLTGCLTATSWCYGPEGEVWILGSDGLYVFAQGGGFTESVHRGSLSREKLPDELRTIDPTVYEVKMEYDIPFRGVHIYIVPINAVTGTLHWWVDRETLSFWPVELDSDHEPTALTYYNADTPSDEAVLLGGRDGYVRKYSRAAATDDGEDFLDNSYCLIGPVHLATNDAMVGIIDEIVGVPALDGGNVALGIKIGETKEAAFVADTEDVATLTPGLNATHRVRRRGQAVYIRLGGITQPWTMERLTIGRIPMGRQRIG